MIQPENNLIDSLKRKPRTIEGQAMAGKLAIIADSLGDNTDPAAYALGSAHNVAIILHLAEDSPNKVVFVPRDDHDAQNEAVFQGGGLGTIV